MAQYGSDEHPLEGRPDSPARAAELLGIALGADPEEIRSAYLRGVAAHPPDRSPAEFERIRDAYRLLSDPRRRHVVVLDGPDPLAPLTTLLDDVASSRAHVGVAPWLAALEPRGRAVRAASVTPSTATEDGGS